MFLNTAINNGALKLNPNAPTSFSGGIGYVGTSVAANLETDASDVFIGGLRVSESGIVRISYSNLEYAQNGFPLTSSGQLCVTSNPVLNGVAHGGIEYTSARMFTEMSAPIDGAVAEYLKGQGITVTGSGVSNWADQSTKPELIVNGGFATDSDWTKNAGWTIGGGVASCDGTQAGTTNLFQVFPGTVGDSYLVTFTVSSYSAGSVRPSVGFSGAGTFRSANGTYSEVIVASGNAALFMQGDADFVGDIDNVSVVAIQNDLLQATDTNRPLPKNPNTTGAELAESANYGAPAGFDNTITALSDTSFTSVGNTTASRVYLNFPTVIGKTYAISVNLDSQSPVEGISVQIRDASDGLGNVYDFSSVRTEFSFVAVTTAANVFFVGATAGGDFAYNNITIKEATGFQSILFDGVDNFLKTVAFTLNQPTTVYILFKQVTWTDQDYIIDGGTSNKGVVFQNSATPQLNIFAGTTTGANTDLSLNSYDVASIIFNGASSLLQIGNGSSSNGDAGTSDMGGLTLAAQGSGFSSSNIQVKEVIIYPVARTTNENTLMQAYLANVGDLTISGL